MCFQIFHDMVKRYVDEGIDEYPDDPESIGFVHYDFGRLLVEDADHPFFADRLFANRLMAHAEAMKRGGQQNKLYIFDGPPGCGKSTFLNNLLMKFEEYAGTEEGLRFENRLAAGQPYSGRCQSAGRPSPDGETDAPPDQQHG